MPSFDAPSGVRCRMECKGITPLRPSATMDISELKSAVETHNDAQTLRAMSWDSGRILFRAPCAVVRPRSPDDVAETIRWARRVGARVAVRGMGHTQHGQSLVEGGVSIDMRGLNRIGALEGDTLEVEAGATWRAVIANLAKQGLLPPVLTNNLDTTVGGTISTAGIGTSSHCRGVQAGHVEALETVTGRGEALCCSRSVNADLFDATRCGLGQFSVVTKARIRVRRTPPRIRTFHFDYDNLEGLMRDQGRMLSTGRFQHLRAWCLPRDRRADSDWRYRLSAGAECETEPDDRTLLHGLRPPARREDRAPLEWNRHEWVDKAQRQAGPEVCCPVTEACIPTQAAERLPDLFAQLPRALLAASDVLFQPLEFPGETFPPSLMIPDTGPVLAVSLIPFIPVAALPRALPIIEEAGRRLTALGGKRYLSGWVRYDHEEWKAHFGEKWRRVLAWKETFDPDGILGGGFIRYRPDH